MLWESVAESGISALAVQVHHWHESKSTESVSRLQGDEQTIRSSPNKSALAVQLFGQWVKPKSMCHANLFDMLLHLFSHMWMFIQFKWLSTASKVMNRSVESIVCGACLIHSLCQIPWLHPHWFLIANCSAALRYYMWICRHTTLPNCIVNSEFTRMHKSVALVKIFRNGWFRQKCAVNKCKMLLHLLVAQFLIWRKSATTTGPMKGLAKVHIVATHLISFPKYCIMLDRSCVKLQSIITKDYSWEIYAIPTNYCSDRELAP